MRAFLYSFASSMLFALVATSALPAHGLAEDSPPSQKSDVKSSEDSADQPKDDFNTVRQRLAKPISVTWKGTPFKEAFMEVVVHAKVDMVVDRIPHEVFDAQVHLLLNKCPADVVLRQMLFQIDPELDFAIRDGFVLIARRDRLDAIYEARVYPGSVLPSFLTSGVPVDSYTNDQPTEKLRQLLSVVEPLSWEQNGGMGRMALTNSSLVVWQSPRVHEQIADLFEELQKADRESYPAARQAAVPTIAPIPAPATSAP